MLPRRQVRQGDKVVIVQHPHGAPKTVASGTVRAVRGTHLVYDCETLPGSSGSPVLNENWALVGLHRSGGMSLDGQLQNEGTPCGAILEHLERNRLAFA